MAEDTVTAARQDLAGRLGVPVDRIAVDRVEEVEWRDASLGCPEPGRMYAQVITPGSRIVLRVDSQTYEYHADQRGRVVFCENPREWHCAGGRCWRG